MKNEERGKIVGIHTLSLSDIRDEKVKKIQDIIIEKIEVYKAEISKLKLSLLENEKSIIARPNKHLFEHKKLLKEKCERVSYEHSMKLQELFLIMRGHNLTNQITVKNIIPTAGRAVIARWIAGNNTYDASNGANYGSLGDDNTTPANGDTILGNETYRKAISSPSFSSNVAYLSNFYTATEVTGTFEEAGWHIDGGAGVDTGQLLSHFLTTSITKSGTETLTIESQLTIS